MVQDHLMARATRFLSPVSALLLALMPVCVSGQSRSAARNEVVWHWFGGCVSSDSLILEVHFDGKSVYSSAFPICQARRAEITPEPQQRVLEFRFDGAPRRFRTQNKSTGIEPIRGNIWEARGERDAIRLGISFSTELQVLLNMVHVARAHSPSRSERVRGLVITTRPVQRGDRTPPNKRLKPPGAGERAGARP